MRRSEKAIADRADIDTVIRSCQVCRLGLCDQGEPYIVPMCFGYDGQAIFLHAAQEGRKINIIRQHPRVCFEFDRMLSVKAADSACAWGLRYQSAIGTGTATILDNADDKRYALTQIMAQYSNGAYTFPEQALMATLILRVDVETVSGKQAL